MKITRKLAVVDTTNRMTVAFDVGKAMVNYYSEVQGKLSGNNCKEIQAIEGEVENNIDGLTKAIENLDLFAHTQSKAGLHVVCESTGVYSDYLMRLARQKGCTTAWVSGEVVNRAKVIENNDASKNDLKDPRVIFMLSTMGKEQTHRQLPEVYQYLRELNRTYDEQDERRSALRTQVELMIYRLFADFPMSKDFIFTESGNALIQAFGCNPYRIAAASMKTFSRRLQKAGGRFLPKTVEKLHAAAIQSTRMTLSARHIEALEQRLRFQWDDYCNADRRRDALRIQIEQVYQELWEKGENVPQSDNKALTPFLLGRILGETGPLDDFTCWEQLVKYAGLNLRTRESGSYRGRLKISKKGRITLRLLLGKAVFRMIKLNHIFGEYYHRRKTEEHIRGKNLIGLLERKLLRIVFACKNRTAFDESRMTTCESQYKKAA